MTFTAIVTAHAQDPSRILGNLLYQTRKPDEIIVFYSDLDPIDVRLLKHDFPLVLWAEVENRNDWGHEKRSQGLAAASGDVVGFFNADDSYANEYIEKLMAEIESGADVAYCGWNSQPGCAFVLGSSTSGNYVVRTEIARQAGYTDRVYEADGLFINRIAALTPNIVKVDEILYFHNEVR